MIFDRLFGRRPDGRANEPLDVSMLGIPKTAMRPPLRRGRAADELFEPKEEPLTYGDVAGRSLLRALKYRLTEEANAPFVPIIPDAVQVMWRREKIARALYEDWVKEDELTGNEYVEWLILLDKATWYSRADAVIAADPKE